MTSPKAILRKDYQPSDYYIDTTGLVIKLGENGTQVTGTLSIHRAEHANANAPLKLNGIDLKLKSVKIDGKALAKTQYELNGEHLTIPNLPKAFTLETIVEIHPENNTALEGIYQSGKMFASQCEAQGFRKITYTLDRPDILSTFTVKIIGDKTRYPVMLSNGNKIDAGDLDHNQHFVTWQDPIPKPCYLFALVAGDLAVIKDTFKTLSGKTVALEIYAYQQDINKCHYAMQSLKDAMTWDEQRFGREYDLDVYMIVAVPDFNSGAMENKGLNLFNTKYVLADDKTATDKDFELVQAVIAHEYFHNWTGNRITCRDWFQLSLKEGLTVFRDQEFTSDHHARDVKRIEDAKIIRAAQFAEDASPMSHPIRPDSYIEMRNFYTLTVYNKGAEVIRMQHTLLGEDAFRKGMDLYFERHDGQAVTCDDFVNALSDANDQDWIQFKVWYEQSGTPEITVTDEYDVKTQTYTLTLKQHTPPTADQKTKKALHIPVRIGLLDQQGKTLVDTVLELKASEQQFTFKNIAAQPIPSLLRNFSAPVKLEYDYTDAQLLHLFAHDDDPFNRWDAGQILAKKIIFQGIETVKSGQTFTCPPAFINAIQTTLHDKQLDPALISEAVTLPSINALAEAMPVILVDELVQVHHALTQQLADALCKDWQQVYKQYQTDTPYDHQHENVAKRKLKNTCLYYLMQASDQSIGTALAQQQFAQANNMTDQLAAFGCLLQNTEKAIREQAIEHFYQQWQNEALVMDKWFTQQALMPHDDTVAQVTALAKHPAFNIRNPNKVYALVGAFNQNLAQFHRADGAGYQFLVDRVLQLNEFNPQVAARMVRGLMNWKRLEPKRQAMMKQALKQLHQAKLSNDVFEIVEKSLA